MEFTATRSSMDSFDVVRSIYRRLLSMNRYSTLAKYIRNGNWEFLEWGKYIGRKKIAKVSRSGFK
jgi:hypothetical protein